MNPERPLVYSPSALLRRGRRLRPPDPPLVLLVRSTAPDGGGSRMGRVARVDVRCLRRSGPGCPRGGLHQERATSAARRPGLCLKALAQRAPPALVSCICSDPSWLKSTSTLEGHGYRRLLIRPSTRKPWRPEDGGESCLQACRLCSIQHDGILHRATLMSNLDFERALLHAVACATMRHGARAIVEMRKVKVRSPRPCWRQARSGWLATGQCHCSCGCRNSAMTQATLWFGRRR